MTRARAVLPLVVALAGAGCAAFTTKGDYADYRAVRLEHDDRARLLAMQRYTARHPDGRYYDQIQRERRERDRPVFEAGKSDRAGLELYLAAFPDGIFVDQAKSRLSVVAVIEQRKAEEQRRAARLVEERKQHEIELARTWVTRFFGYWARTLASLRNWGSPIEQVAHENADFSRAFGRPPRPSCTEDECVKYYESAFAVPVPGGTRMERSMRLVLRLRLDRGQLTRAELLFPGLGFSRWRELEERVAVVDGDVEARKHAVDWALEHIGTLLDNVAPDRKALEGYALKEIPKPAIGPSGELVDTTAEDPSAPPNQIQGEAAPAPTQEPSVGELVKPRAKEQTPDMELGPIQVGKDGRALSSVPAQPPSPSPQAGGPEAPVMELGPLAVPRADGAPAPPPAEGAATPAAPAAPAVEVVPATVKAFQAGALRLIVFAAASDAKSPAYDGFVIELGGGDSRARRNEATKRKPAAGSPATPSAPPASKPATPPAGH